jgi:spoIIIJ-associated protein
MGDQRATLEVIAPTVEEAVQKGVSELGLKEEDVEVEVLDEGTKGLFGLRGRQVRVKLTVKDEGFEMESMEAVAKVPMEIDETTENVMSIAQETVMELLEKMDIRAEVSAHLGESEEGDRDAPIIVDIAGNDLSILIGRKAETLNALQFITRMIVGKEVGHAAHILVDVEGYRVRREQSLRRLARKMAEQAIKSGRKQILEPMPPNERRVIHIELRDNPDVETESVDQEPRRKVTVSPVQR